MGCFPANGVVTVEVSGSVTDEKEAKKEDKKEDKKEEKKVEQVTRAEVKKEETITKVEKIEEVKEEVREETTEVKEVTYTETKTITVVKEESSTSEVVSSSQEQDTLTLEFEFNVVHEEKPSDKFYDMPLAGWMTKGGEKVEMDLKRVELGENGKIRINGTDEHGDYKLKGIFSPDGKVLLEKKYEASDKQFKFKGAFNDKGDIEGKWFGKHDKQSGEFLIQLGFNAKMNDLEHNNAFAGFVNGPQRIGLIQHKDGWAVIREVKDGEFELMYAKGWKKTMKFVYSDDCIIADSWNFMS